MLPRRLPALVVSSIVVSACENSAQIEFDARSAQPSETTSSITASLVVATQAQLPRCGDALNGTTAYVQEGALLFSCSRGSWARETCTLARAGEVAFITGEQFLLACSARTWVRVELPSGPAGAPGPAGRDALIASAAEPAGANCEHGGVRVDTGVDTDGSGTLESDEVSTTSYVCSAAAGESAPILTATRAALPSECRTGGQAITLYRDDNGSASIDTGEALGAPLVVCNGDAALSYGANPVVKAYRSANEVGVLAGEGDAGTAKVLSASITAPGTGTVLVLASSMAYCSAPSVPVGQGVGRCALPSGTTFAWLTVVDASSTGQAGNSGAAIPNTGLQDDTDTQLSVMATFEVSAGTYSYDVLGMAGEYTPDAAETSVYYGASELTLVFIPHG